MFADLDEFIRDISFSSCTAISSITLLLDPNPFHRQALTWPTFCALVASILQTAPLRHVRMQVGFRTSLMGAMLHPWNGMDNVLSKFEGLERLTFLSHALSTTQERFTAVTEEAKDLIRAAYPKVARKAIVDFDAL